MIPSLVNLLGTPWPVLPPGVHPASLGEVKKVFATNHKRRELFKGFVEASYRLRLAGCTMVYLDGSYVTGKPNPGDFDGCWDESGINNELLDPLFRDFSNGTQPQKETFGGEFFPAFSFLDFFQMDRDGLPKGIISISLQNDPLILRRENNDIQ